ncbi:MAG: zf-HC2 domain-containing protein [Terracidiphilus sp.]|jgi:anti-sigma factor (TIGR02949 family)
MNGCSEVLASLTEYLDGRMTGHEMQAVDGHLESCRECAREFETVRSVQASLSSLGPVPAPADLPLRIRVALSQESARSRRSILDVWDLAWRNTVGPFLLQAGAGLASATLLLGTVILLITVFAKPEAAQATPDEPLGNATAPHLLYFSNAQGDDQMDAVNGPVMVEAYVNDAGQVYDYRILSGPVDDATRSQVENLLLFSRFEPARFFGQPVRGLAVLSFSGVSVRG